MTFLALEELLVARFIVLVFDAEGVTHQVALVIIVVARRCIDNHILHGELLFLVLNQSLGGLRFLNLDWIL